MLTGDKQETAINIAYSCGLFQVRARVQCTCAKLCDGCFRITWT